MKEAAPAWTQALLAAGLMEARWPGCKARLTRLRDGTHGVSVSWGNEEVTGTLAECQDWLAGQAPSSAPGSGNVAGPHAGRTT